MFNPISRARSDQVIISSHMSGFVTDKIHDITAKIRNKVL